VIWGSVCIRAGHHKYGEYPSSHFVRKLEVRFYAPFDVKALYHHITSVLWALYSAQSLPVTGIDRRDRAFHVIVCEYNIVVETRDIERFLKLILRIRPLSVFNPY
jgi:hypothetical protein